MGLRHEVLARRLRHPRGGPEGLHGVGDAAVEQAGECPPRGGHLWRRPHQEDSGGGAPLSQSAGGIPAWPELTPWSMYRCSFLLGDACIFLLELRGTRATSQI